MRNIVSLAFAAAVAVSPLAHADSNHAKKDHGGHGTAAQGASARAADMVEGEVRRVDKDAKKITIKHGPIDKFEMPAMTMVFQVSDPAMLDQVKTGDKVKFQADKVGGAFTLTKIEPAQ